MWIVKEKIEKNEIYFKIPVNVSIYKRPASVKIVDKFILPTYLGRYQTFWTAVSRYECEQTLEKR